MDDGEENKELEDLKLSNSKMHKIKELSKPKWIEQIIPMEDFY